MKRSREHIREEYVRKLALYEQLVGRLYPRVLYAELLRLQQEYGEPNDLPSETGYVQ